MKEKISFAEFLDIEKKIEIKLGRVETAERVKKSKKLLVLTVDFGEESLRQVVTNIGDQVEPESLVMQFPFVTNLEPATIMGLESTAMIMPSVMDGKITLFPFNGSTLM
jgi:methionyl-tRNA synthetase